MLSPAENRHLEAFHAVFRETYGRKPNTHERRRLKALARSYPVPSPITLKNLLGDIFVLDPRERPDLELVRWFNALHHSSGNACGLVFADWLEEHGDTDQAEFIRADPTEAVYRAKGKIRTQELTQDGRGVFYLCQRQEPTGWKTYADEYTAVSKEEMVATMRAAMARTEFVPPDAT